jgi:branched-chain amino acid transport system substrate-binding protein
MPKRMPLALLSVIAIIHCLGRPAMAEDMIKVGVVLPLTGPFTSTGRQILSGAQLYLQRNGDEVAGKKIKLIVRDDANAADQTKRLTQELIVNEKVSVLAGYGLTPLAFTAAPIATTAQMPMVVMGAATSSVTEKSPFIVRTSFPQGASPYILAAWMARNGIKTAATLVSDFAPGYDSEAVFSSVFQAAGGKVLDKIRVPLQSPDFAPFLQKARDVGPEALFVFVPAGQAATMFRQFVERGLDKSGIRLFGAGDVTDDDVLNSIGDAAIGTVTAHQYSAHHKSPANTAFREEFQKLAGTRPNFFAVGGYDGMHLIKAALEKTSGDATGVALVEAMKGMAWDSPRGPISIDPATRDIVQDIYIRKVEKIDGQLWNVEFETFQQVKDPVKAGQIK